MHWLGQIKYNSPEIQESIRDHDSKKLLSCLSALLLAYNASCSLYSHLSFSFLYSFFRYMSACTLFMSKCKSIFTISKLCHSCDACHNCQITSVNPIQSHSKICLNDVNLYLGGMYARARAHFVIDQSADLFTYNYYPIMCLHFYLVSSFRHCETEVLWRIHAS